MRNRGYRILIRVVTVIAILFFTMLGIFVELWF